ncbi:tRNA pseudouridine(38-40) synthase TruA [Candidatus Dependentiae bacterium]|nr:tRNA pseudouridine(38-40) synthase TruA [Candidatus Dependentiae bacterium]
MPFYKMVVAYDGTAYHGWQRQRSVTTIVGELERSFKEVFKKDISIVGASRTDAGVHALGQVARFFLEEPLPVKRIRFAWNNVLPPAILIRSLEEVTDSFHPQRGVTQKIYQYHIFEKRPLPLYARYGYFSGKLDREKLEKGLQFFVGTHDYRSFCTGHEAESTVRSIHSIVVMSVPRYGALRISVSGPGFLRYMVRRIVGACIDVASSPQRPISELSSALEEKDPRQNLHVAPSCGLVLRSIQYEHDSIETCSDDDYSSLLHNFE